MAGPSKESDVLLSSCFLGPGFAWNPGILGEALRAPEFGERERLCMVRNETMYIPQNEKQEYIYPRETCGL